MAGSTTRKICIWTTDRSLGTVVLKALSSTKDAVIFDGLFTAAYFYGPQRPLEVVQKTDDEKVRKRMSSYKYLLDDDVFTYDWAEKCFAASYPGKTVFFKDQAYALRGMYHKLPEDSHHSFIIRHPLRVLASMKKYMAACYGAEPGEYFLQTSFLQTSADQGITPLSYLRKEVASLYQNSF